MPKISVIVPIYNVEKYLRNCLESIAKQSFNDFDVYMINDGSPDNSQKIIDEYASKYPNKFIPIIKENGGYGSVLELAFNKTDAQFVLVCDGDDSLETNCLEILNDLQEKYNADLVIGSKNLIYEDNNQTDYSCSYNKEYVNELLDDQIYTKEYEHYQDLFFIDPSPHAKLYRRDIVKNIKFPEKVSYTDNLLFYYALINSNIIIYTSKPLANYLINRQGNSMSDISNKALNGQVKVFNEIYDQCNKFDCPNIFYYRMFESFKYILYQTQRLNCNKDEYTETFQILKTFLDRLINHHDNIIPLYNEYSNTKILERLNDKQLLNPKESEKAFNKLFKKYKERHFKK